MVDSGEIWPAQSNLAAQAAEALRTRSERDLVTTTAQIETLKNVSQLWEIADANKIPNTWSTAQDTFRRTGMQMIDNASNPFDVVAQGAGSPTCGLANLEFCLYTRHPDQATRVVGEVLRTGKFITKDGTEIKLDPLTLEPDRFALQAFRDPFQKTRDRNYASQIFQNTAANIHWQRQAITPDGRTVPKGSLRFEYHPKLRDIDTEAITSLVDYSRGQRERLGSEPITTSDNHKDIITQIVGAEAVPKILQSNSPALKTQKSFYDYLRSLKEPDDFPLMLIIDGPALAFGRSGERLNHSITLISPAAKDGQMNFYNSWTHSNKTSTSEQHLFDITLRQVLHNGEWVYSRTKPK
jgi:hypothetical protein